MKKYLKIGTVLGTFVLIICIFLCFKHQIFTSPEAFQAYITGFGIWAPLLFIVIQIMQVVFPIIPGGLTCVGGVLCFGPVWGFFYNYISICIGSCINFLLIRRYGKPLLIQLSSQKVYEKYIGWLDTGKRFDKLFAFAIFMPVAPDDFLCMLAGLTNMSFQKFVTIIVLCKPLSILAYSMGFVSLLMQINHFLLR